MSKERLLEEIQKRLDEASLSDGFFITITARNDDELKHYSAQSNFKAEDLIPSVNKTREMILEKFGINPIEFQNRTYN